MINVEFKHHSVALNSLISDSGTMLLLNGVAQNDTGTTRDGDSIRVKSLQTNGLITINSAQTTATLRRIIFIDLQSDGSTPLSAELLDTSSVPAVAALRNLEYRHRYLILKDSIVHLSTDGQRSRQLATYRKMDLKVLFDGTGTTITSLKNHPLYVADTASNHSTLVATHRIRYIDN